MNDTLLIKPRKPGIVIFVSVLNFISAAFCAAAFIFSIIALLFGSSMNLQRTITEQYPQVTDLSFGFTFLFLLIFVFSAFLLAFFLFIAIGLLKGNKIAWYLQIIMSVAGLLGFPMGTVVNLVILIFFFQPPIRNYYKV